MISYVLRVTWRYNGVVTLKIEVSNLKCYNFISIEDIVMKLLVYLDRFLNYKLWKFHAPTYKIDEVIQKIKVDCFVGTVGTFS